MSSTTIPKTMCGVEIKKIGGPEVLDYRTDLPVPAVGESHLLVKNAFIGVNFIDTYFRTGLYPSAKPEILGREAAGTVVAVGSGNAYGIEVGDKVAWLGVKAYAEYSSVPAEKVIKLPEGVSEKEAAASLLQGLTALTLVREAHPTKAGEWILVHAAAGGVGLWLCKILKAIGAKTIATAGSSSKVELALKAGAEVGVDYTEEGLDGVEKKVQECTGGEGVAAVFDGVGRWTFDSSLACLKRKGTMVSFGNASGAVPPLPLTKLTTKNIKLLRPMLFGYISTRDEFETASNDLWQLMVKEKMDVRIHDVYALKNVADAHRDLEGRKTTGKVLLQP